MKTDPDGLPEDHDMPNSFPSSAFKQPLFFCLDKKFHLIYYSILTFIFINSIGSLNQGDSWLIILILGLSLSIFTSILSLSLILIEHYKIFSPKIKSSLYIGLYTLTGLVIISTDPKVLNFFSNTSSSLPSSLLQLLFPYTFIGSRYLLKSRSIYFCITFLVLVMGFAFSWPTTQILNHVLSYCLLAVYIYSINSDFKEPAEVPESPCSEEASSFKILDPTTPLEEIIVEIHDGIGKIMDVSKNTAPGIQRIYKKIISLLKNILVKIQQSDNIYHPRLDLVTKNMDEDDKRYIEQECFDRLNFGMNPMHRRQSIQNVLPIKQVEYGMSELSGFLRQIGKEWNFDSFFVAKCSKKPAFIIGMYTVKMYGLNDFYRIKDEVLEGFLNELENGYPQNPYHNSTHGADVMCSFIYFVSKSRLCEAMTTSEWLCGIVASLAHDIGHPGKNNRFLVMTGNEIAIEYNDISVLEMMHASRIFRILSNSEFNIFSGLRPEKFVQCRKLIIDMILSTDMSKHFDIVSCMRTKYNETSDIKNREIRADLFRLCLKSADVGHAAKSIELHEKWCYLVLEEFFSQGDEEKKRNLPVSMYCDKETTNIAKSQAGFIKNIVLNLFMTLNFILDSEEIEETCLKQLRYNEAYWQGLTKQRNLSTVHKQDKKEEKNILPLLKRKSFRKGSLPPLYKSLQSTNL